MALSSLGRRRPLFCERWFFVPAPECIWACLVRVLGFCFYSLGLYSLGQNGHHFIGSAGADGAAPVVGVGVA